MTPFFAVAEPKRVRLSAPYSMPGHYKLPVKYCEGGRTVTGVADIPEGGVLTDEMFEAEIIATRPLYGRWKQGVFDCFESKDSEFCVFCFLCPLGAWGCLYESAFRRPRGSCWMVLLILAFVYNILFFNHFGNPDSRDSDSSPVLDPLGQVINVLGLIIVFTACVIRGKIRQKYQIPGNACIDCLCTYFCGCCTVLQAYEQLRTSNEHPHLRNDYRDATLIV